MSQYEVMLTMCRKKYAACLVCSVFGAACTIIGHERQHVVLWWFEAVPEVHDGVGGSKWT